MFYAYVLKSLSAPEEFCRGHTRDLKLRVAEHNTGKCSHSAKFRPWKVKFYAAFETIELAQDFEHYLKSGSGHAFAKNILVVDQPSSTPFLPEFRVTWKGSSGLHALYAEPLPCT